MQLFGVQSHAQRENRELHDLIIQGQEIVQHLARQHHWQDQGIPSKQYSVDGEDDHIFHRNTENNIFGEKQLLEFDRLEHSKSNTRIGCVSLVGEQILE